MSLQVVLLLGALAALVGVSFGYFLRWIISLGKKGSVELEIKQMLLEAKEEAKRITEESQTKAEGEAKTVRGELKEKEDKLKKTEDRLIKKEELLDKRQVDIDKEVEDIKVKIAEIKKIKEKVEKMESDKQNELQKVANLSEEQAKAELIGAVERKYEEDMVVRMNKLEQTGHERLEKKAQEILTTSIQRLGNSVSADILSTAVTIPSDDLKGKIIGKE